jgi:hypothetical protein
VLAVGAAAALLAGAAVAPRSAPAVYIIYTADAADTKGGADASVFAFAWTEAGARALSAADTELAVKSLRGRRGLHGFNGRGEAVLVDAGKAAPAPSGLVTWELALAPAKGSPPLTGGDLLWTGAPAVAVLKRTSVTPDPGVAGRMTKQLLETWRAAKPTCESGGYGYKDFVVAKPTGEAVGGVAELMHFGMTWTPDGTASTPEHTSALLMLPMGDSDAKLPAGKSWEAPFLGVCSGPAWGVEPGLGVRIDGRPVMVARTLCGCESPGTALLDLTNMRALP